MLLDTGLHFLLLFPIFQEHKLWENHCNTFWGILNWKQSALMYACLQKAITVVIDRRWASDL